MSDPRWLVSFAIALGLTVAGTAGADDFKPASLADQLWAVSDAVLEHHIQPPARQEMLPAAAKPLVPPSEQTTPAALARRLSSVTTREQFADFLKEYHVGPADAQMTERGLNALLRAVPGRPVHLEPGSLKAIEQLADNRYVGTGIQVRMHQEEQLVQIVLPFPGAPARKAGARSGDLIVSVDGAEMKGKTLQQVVEKLRGAEGTRVVVAVRQPGEKETRTLDMIRSVVPFESAVGCRRLGEESWEFQPDSREPIAYVRFLNLTSSTPSELAKLEKLLKEAGTRGLVLDLRTAQGTQFQPLLLLADALLDGGTIWKVRDVQGRIREHKADRDCLFRELPLAVLVDEDTDPFAVLLAAAL